MKKEDMRIVFFGTSEFAVVSLRVLIDNNYNVVGVVTVPDNHFEKRMSFMLNHSVKCYAVFKKLPVLQPQQLKDAIFINQLKQWKPELQIVVSFRILPKIIWDLPCFGTFNLHASLLPQYRGPAPINWAIINGEKETGVTTFFINDKVDTGQIIAQARIKIKETDNVGTLRNTLMIIGSELVMKTIDVILQDKIILLSQTDIEPNEKKLKLAPKIFREHCKIDWNQTINGICYFIRGLSPSPGAWTELKPLNKRKFSIKILEVESSDISNSLLPVGSIFSDKKNFIDIRVLNGWVRLKTIQVSGKKRMFVQDFLRGNAHLL